MPMMTIFRVLFFVNLLILSITAQLYAGKHAYPELANELSFEIYDILISSGLCKDINICRKQQRVGAGGSPIFAKISVYEVDSIDKEDIQKIIGLCIKSYYNKNKKNSIRLRLYSEKAENAVQWFSGIEPKAELILNKE